ncbi:hypothetical protein A9Q99_10980 [Gammaproteobacteria bacterium 45_16_T64]|nr:hypothetical protein A9Q99_10980 [Gammaproteobacteria bacterium 45_16_T64]
MKIVLTGATGFVGRALVSNLSILTGSREPIEIRALVRTPAQFVAPENVTVFPGSVTDIPEGLFFDEPHVLIHLGVKQIDHDGTGFDEDNVFGTKNLLSNTNQHTLGVIYGSTLSVLGQGAQSNTSERDVINPQTPLARSRAEAERLILTKMKQDKHWGFCLRPRFILDVSDKFVLPGIQGLAKKGLYIGNGQQRFSIISVQDYAKIIIELVEYILLDNGQKPVQQTPLNVGYRRPVTFDSIFSGFRLEMSYRSKVKRLRMPGWLPLLLKGAKNRKLTAKAVQLELIGFDHYGDVNKLETFIGDEITKKDGEDILYQMIKDITTTSC